MTKSIPTVSHYMTTMPHSIGRDQTLRHAHEMMRKHHIRHLPVLDGGELVGVVSDRDLHLVETLRDVDPETIAVEEAMTPEPFTVGPDAPLDEVTEQMAERKYGSAIVVDHHHVVGVFTAVDAMRACADLLRTRLRR